MNRITEMLGCKYPIIQSPMGWIARSQLASAVSNAGGFGIIETSSGEVDQCKDEIRKMASLTNSPFGVNLPILFLSDESMLEVVIEENVKFVTTSAGDPAKYIHKLKEADIKVFHAVPSLAGALKAVDAGVDGLVVEGNDASIAVVEVEEHEEGGDHDDHGMALHVEGVSAGSTSFQLKLMHDGHADYTSTNNVPVTVN